MEEILYDRFLLSIDSYDQEMTRNWELTLNKNSCQNRPVGQYD